LAGLKPRPSGCDVPLSCNKDRKIAGKMPGATKRELTAAVLFLSAPRYMGGAEPGVTRARLRRAPTAKNAEAKSNLVLFGYGACYVNDRQNCEYEGLQHGYENMKQDEWDWAN
jgi:hypothetical protein